MDDLTHTITVSIIGNYPHGNKQHASVSIIGTGDLDHMMGAFKAALVAAGFSPATAAKLNMMDT